MTFNHPEITEDVQALIMPRQTELDGLRQLYRIDPAGEAIWFGDGDLEQSHVVEADGFGGATLVVYTGRYHGQRYRDSFTDQHVACDREDALEKTTNVEVVFKGLGPPLPGGQLRSNPLNRRSNLELLTDDFS
jgi:hypothetical protein